MINIDDFNRWHKGKRLCRCPGCPNAPKWPRREYCSDECYESFISYYLQHFQWESAKSKVLRRDDYKCVLCGKGPQRDRWGYGSDHGLEVDHKIAQAIMYHVHYIRYYLPVKLRHKRKNKFLVAYWKRLDEQLNALWNLRTLCKSCHHAKTKNDIRKLKLLRKYTGVTELFFYPTRKHKFYTSDFDPVDKCFEPCIGLRYSHLDRCDIDLNERGRYMHDLLWIFSDKRDWDWDPYKEVPQYLSFCIMFDVLENGRVTQFKYLREDKPTLFNYI